MEKQKLNTVLFVCDILLFIILTTVRLWSPLQLLP